MDYEQKYKEALGWMKSLYGGLHGKTKEEAEKYFPELAESEDERIRKTIIRFFKDQYSNETEMYDGSVTVGKAIAWLEKQGEFKSSKWAEGDVVRHGGILALVTNGRKAMKSNCEQITIQYPDEWVKAETKERKHFFEELEKQGDKSVNIDIESMVSQYKQRLKSQGGVENIHIVDMCLTAFRHGVENVLEELNLKKLEKQSKPKWTDEDEERLQSCIIALQGKGLMGGVDTMDSKWLKSLKQRMEEQQ